MPLALDLISTFVMGWILPVATTLFAKSPWSTVAIFDGSILVPPRVAPSMATTTRIMRTTITDVQITRFLVLLLPFATVGLQSVQQPLVVYRYVPCFQKVPQLNDKFLRDLLTPICAETYAFRLTGQENVSALISISLGSFNS